MTVRQKRAADKGKDLEVGENSVHSRSQRKAHGSEGG